MSDQHARGGGQAPQGLAALEELKLLWSRYGADPEMAKALKEALADGVVTQEELLALRARAKRGPKPEPRASEPEEIQAIKLAFGAGSAEALAADEALKDGVVTPDELASLRSMLARREGPEPKAKPKADPRAIPFPTLAIKTPWRKREGEDGDSGWGS